MRNCVVATTVVVLLATTASHSSGQMRAGARWGLTFANLGGDVDLDSRTGFTGGL